MSATRPPLALEGIPDDRQHRRVALLGYAAWPLLLLQVPIFGIWLFFRLISCSSDVPQQICEWGFLGPLVPGAIIVACLVIVVLTLIQYEQEMSVVADSDGQSWAHPTKVARYTRRGYRRLRPQHRRHVRRILLVFSFALGGFLGFSAFYLGLPALASILIGMVTIISTILFNRWIK
jgi:hypothetical protein